LVRFTGALIADGGRKLLLDGKRGAASDGGNLSISIYIMMNENITYDPILASPLSSCVTLLDGYVMLLPSNTLLLVSSNLLHSQVDEVT
jgi:hypothetical protein